MWKKSFLLLGSLIALCLLAAFFVGGCDTTSKPSESTQSLNIPEPADVTPANSDSISTKGGQIDPTALGIVPSSESTYQGDWSAYILSEAFYALSQARNGTSTISINGLALGNWNYVTSDQWAYNQVAAVNGYVGSVGTTQLAGSVPAYAWIGQGGWCKYFASLVLFRSSYGIGGGYHLVLPSGYNYATQPVTSARPGWVIQNSTSIHTAVVVANLGGGLDVIDANYIGGNGKYCIARHPFSWAQLSGYKAYRPVRMLRFN